MDSATIFSRSFELYPGNEYMQAQWRKCTEYLYQSGKHVLLTGKYPKGNKNA